MRYDYFRTFFGLNKHRDDRSAYESCNEGENGALVMLSSAFKSCGGGFGRQNGSLSANSSLNNGPADLHETTGLGENPANKSKATFLNIYSATVPSSKSGFSYYSTNFTNSIRAKLNHLKQAILVYKGALPLYILRLLFWCFVVFFCMFSCVLCFFFLCFVFLGSAP